MNLNFSKFNFDGLKGIATSSIAFGKKNAPAIMTGGGILLFWGAGYLFWKESKKAEKAILAKEIALQTQVKVEEGEDAVSVIKARSELPKKDKFIVYLQYCWLSWALGAAATGLLIGAQKISIDRLLAMYATAQFFEKKSENQETLIEKLKEKAGIKTDTKAESDIKSEILKEKYTSDTIDSYRKKATGRGPTMFIDEVTGNSFYGDIVKVSDGIAEASAMLVSDYDDQISKLRKRKGNDKLLNDPYFSKSDNVWELINELDSKSDDPNIYSELDLEAFMECIGEISDETRKPCRLGNLLVFRYYGGTDGKKKPKMPIRASRIIKCDPEFRDPVSGQPTVVWLDYEEYLQESDELRGRSHI